MTQNNQSQPNEADALFQSMREMNPIRDDIVDDEAPDEGGGGGDEDETLEERMGNSRKMSDIQVAVQTLNPNLGLRHLNVLKYGRTFPDSYNPLFNMLVKDQMRRNGVSMTEAAVYANTALSISIDGEGRLDIIQLARQGAIGTDEDKGKGLT